MLKYKHIGLVVTYVIGILSGIFLSLLFAWIVGYRVGGACLI